MKVGVEGVSLEGVVMVVFMLVCEALEMVVVVVDSWESLSADAGVSAPSSVVVVSDVVVEIALSVLSSLLMLMTGTSSALLMNFSSKLGGSPFRTMRSAFVINTASSFSCDIRSMVSLPASTVSHITRIRFSIMLLRDGNCTRSAFQCCAEDESISR